ncbi:MAG TPA: PilN domain-containing protein [Solirubrobacteraceae bacterium]|jgi:Tfp pilus assembly protein PilN
MKAVNLLPSDTRGAAKPAAETAAPVAKGGIGPFVVLGVLAACVAALAGYVLTTNTVKQRQADLAEISVRQQAVQAQVAKLKPYADYANATRSRVKTVHDLAAQRFDWEQVLTDISRTIPGDVTLSKLSGDISTDAGSASGDSSLRSDITAPAVTLDGCAPGQTEVARLMARLRDVDGVTRVTLSKSENQKVSATSSGTDERAIRNAMPCGSGVRPNFELVIFFENAPAAVRVPPAGSGSSTTTTTPAPTPTPTATPSSSSADTAQGGATP